MTSDISLFILRVAFGASMLAGHGIQKIMNFPDLMNSFPDPLGAGSAISLSLAVFAEVFCSAAVIAGVYTRLAAFPLFVTMVVAAAIIHIDDPWAKKELAVLYGSVFLGLMIMGGGRIALVRKGFGA